ncbi:hypothetical protein [Lysinibacillus sp. Ag94]|uniref:hypothetical protein n=1 Tax=Lysinibacillus sp. Ag94 TaxID=2936682 RepID=UPI00200F26BC|nr:hypothetical protein [Lysinibacillus sp. Ag94]UPW84717.1 hypothetical protein MY533_07635 [Lysinibacillus sp. Ag94]
MNHPYKKYETTELWHIISEAIGELVANQNIEEMTSREYIVGYLCAKLSHMEEDEAQNG